MKFTKMTGIGNDYVYIDCFYEKVENPSELVKKISNRNYGIGSDGLILIKPGTQAPFKMEMYNPDGSQAEMCGNGLRCVAKYIYDDRKTKDKIFPVETGAGILSVEITKTDENNNATMIKLNMGKPILKPSKIPVHWNKDKIINEKLPLSGIYLKFTAISMGNPHCVIFLDSKEDLKNINIKHYGPEIENADIFPKRTNVEFVYVDKNKKNEIHQRTWERGTGETLACGTGACASVVAGILNGHLDRKQKIINHLLGGDLIIEWSEENDIVYLEGDAVKVFNGEWLL